MALVRRKRSNATIERRKAQRIQVPLKIDFKLHPHAKVLSQTLALDISGWGIHIILTEVVKKGQKINTRISFPEEKKPITAVSRVIWVKKYKSSKGKISYEAGLQYLKIMPRDRTRFTFLFCELLINYCLEHQKGK